MLLALDLRVIYHRRLGHSYQQYIDFFGLFIILLNGESVNWRNWSTEKPFVRCKLNASRQEALHNLTSRCEAFCSSPLAEFKVGDFSKIIRTKAIDYSGEEVTYALPLKLEELLPGLPDSGAEQSHYQSWSQDHDALSPGLKLFLAALAGSLPMVMHWYGTECSSFVVLCRCQSARKAENGFEEASSSITFTPFGGCG